MTKPVKHRVKNLTDHALELGRENLELKDIIVKWKMLCVILAMALAGAFFSYMGWFQ